MKKGEVRTVCGKDIKDPWEKPLGKCVMPPGHKKNCSHLWVPSPYITKEK